MGVIGFSYTLNKVDSRINVLLFMNGFRPAERYLIRYIGISCIVNCLFTTAFAALDVKTVLFKGCGVTRTLLLSAGISVVELGLDRSATLMV